MTKQVKLFYLQKLSRKITKALKVKLTGKVT